MKRAVLLCAAAFPAACLADQPFEPIKMDGWYVGGAFGQAKAAGFCSDVPDITSTALVTCDERVDYFKAFLGYEILPMVAVEAGYHPVGNFKLTMTDGVDTLSGAAKGSAATLRGVFNLRADPFFAFVAVGIARWDVKLDVKLNSATIYSARDSGYSMHWGAGVGGDINKWWSVRLEYEAFPNVGEEATTGQDDIKAISLGVLYRF